MIGLDNIDQEVTLKLSSESESDSSDNSDSEESSVLEETEAEKGFGMEPESAFWFNCETRMNLTVVTLLLTFDRRVPVKEFCDRVSRALPSGLFKCVSIKTPDGALSWGLDPDFDPRLHFHVYGLPSPGGDKELQVRASVFFPSSYFRSHGVVVPPGAGV